MVVPGIDYNYKKLFPKWLDEKIRRATKEISFLYADNFDDDSKIVKINYAICNLIPYHRGNKTADLFKVKQDKWGGIICTFFKFTLSLTLLFMWLVILWVIISLTHQHRLLLQLVC